MAGSQFLYLPTHYIEPSSPVFCARNTEGRQRRAKRGEEGRCQDSVSILRSGVVLRFRCAAAAASSGPLIRRCTETLDVGERHV